MDGDVSGVDPDGIHVSGHLRAEDRYAMLDALEPRNVIPAHQDMKGLSGYVDLASSQGYKLGRDIHPSANGNIMTIT